MLSLLKFSWLVGKQSLSIFVLVAFFAVDLEFSNESCCFIPKESFTHWSWLHATRLPLANTCLFYSVATSVSILSKHAAHLFAAKLIEHVLLNTWYSFSKHLLFRFSDIAPIKVDFTLWNKTNFRRIWSNLPVGKINDITLSEGCSDW